MDFAFSGLDLEEDLKPSVNMLQKNRVPDLA